MVYNKSVVLSSIDNSLKKAVLDLDGKFGKIKGSVRLYNFMEEPMGILSLGLLIDGKVNKTGLTRVGYMVYNFNTNLVNIPENCTCALISSKNGNFEPILLGAISGNNSTMEERLISGLSALEQSSVNSVRKILEENSIEFDNDDEIEKEINEHLNINDCEQCVYKSVFFKENKQNKNQQSGNQQILNKLNSKNFITNLNKLENDILNLSKNDINFTENKKEISNSAFQELKKGKNAEETILVDDALRDIKSGRLKSSTETSFYFFDEISSQLDLLFEKYPADEILCDIIPNSKWVKIDNDIDNEKFYVVGLIYFENEVKYVCYGFPAEWSEKPPADFNEKAQWLPIDIAEPHGQGYWITYQDALDGEMVKVDVI